MYKPALSLVHDVQSKNFWLSSLFGLGKKAATGEIAETCFHAVTEYFFINVFGGMFKIPSELLNEMLIITFYLLIYLFSAFVNMEN